MIESLEQIVTLLTPGGKDAAEVEEMVTGLRKSLARDETTKGQVDAAQSLMQQILSSHVDL